MKNAINIILIINLAIIFIILISEIIVLIVFRNLDINFDLLFLVGLFSVLSVLIHLFTNNTITDDE